MITVGYVLVYIVFSHRDIWNLFGSIALVYRRVIEIFFARTNTKSWLQAVSSNCSAESILHPFHRQSQLKYNAKHGPAIKLKITWDNAHSCHSGLVAACKLPFERWVWSILPCNCNHCDCDPCECTAALGPSLPSQSHIKVYEPRSPELVYLVF